MGELLEAAIGQVVDPELSPRALDEFLDRLLDRLRAALDTDSATVLLRDDDGLVVLAASGVDIGRGTRLPLPGSGGEPIAVAGERSLAAAPLIGVDGVLGMLQVGSARPRGFERELALLEVAALRAAGAIERTRLQDERIALERRHRQLVESLSDAVVTLAHDGRITLVNARAEALFGYSRTELVGQPAELLVPERLRAAFAAQRERFLADPVARAGLALAARHRDGHEITVEVSLAPGETEDAAATAFVTDTTARRLLETRLIGSQKLESIGRLAAGVAHDFTNVLTTVSGYAHLALSGLDPRDPAHEDIRGIVRSAERAGQLVNQLQAFSRGERLEVEVIDLNRSVRDVARLLEVMLRESVELELRLRPGMPGVEANLGALEQAVMRLAVNARDAMPDGGRLVIETDMFDRDAEREVWLSLADTGGGMDEDTLRRAFEPFFTTKQRQPGTGLGLTMVYGIVERLHGQIELRSEPGRGTTATIHLPAASDPAVGPEARATATTTILLVEDEDVLRDLVTRILTDDGFVLIAARSGEDALELLDRDGADIDLLVSDVVMPGMSGPELARALRARHPAMKTLLISGYTSMPLGDLDAFLPKPFSPFELARRIRRLLRP